MTASRIFALERLAVDKEAIWKYDGEWAKEHRKFHSVTSFIATKETVQWVRNYIFDTLQYAKKNEESKTGRKWGGWFKEDDWIRWQEHMAELVRRLDILLGSSEAKIELVPSQGPENRETERKEPAS